MIAIVADRWSPPAAGGGREHYAHALVAHLRAGGHTVVTLMSGDKLPADASAVLALTPLATATHYQLHGGLLDAAFAGERAAFSSALRRQLYAPALALNQRRQRLLAAESTMLAGATTFMAFSNADAERLAARGVHPSRVRVQRPGVDLSRFRPGDPPSTPDSSLPRPLRLLFVAHNTVLKGLRTAILAVGRARQRGIDASLLVAGRGVGSRERRLIDREGLSAAIRTEGEASPDRLASLYRTADALIHPTFYDPFPRVCIEALASGCPVLTTASCGAAEIVRHGCEGFIVADPRDVDGFAEAIRTVASTSARRLRHAAAALGQQFDDGAHFRDVAEWLAGTSAAR